jgi:hypothetical protein
MFDDDPNIWKELDSDFKGSDFDDWAEFDDIDLEFDD